MPSLDVEAVVLLHWLYDVSFNYDYDFWEDKKWKSFVFLKLKLISFFPIRFGCLRWAAWRWRTGEVISLSNSRLERTASFFSGTMILMIMVIMMVMVIMMIMVIMMMGRYLNLELKMGKAIVLLPPFSIFSHWPTLGYYWLTDLNCLRLLNIKLRGSTLR